MAKASDDFAGALRAAGLRVTRQRVMVLSVLMQADDHPNADEVFSRIRAIDGSPSFATVYRSLAALEAAGLVQKLNFENEPARYEIAPAAEHDHMIDIDSGEVIEIRSEEITRLRAELVARLGYDIISQHTLVRARRKPQS